jgi:hypothetical protein
MIEMEVDQAKLSEIYRVAHQLNLSGRRQLWIATSKAAQDGKSFIAKRMTKRLGQPQKSIRDMMTIRTTGETGSSLTLKKNRRIPLKQLKPTWKKKGVSYKPGSAARVMIDGAFMGPKHPARFLRFAQGHVFIRKDYTPGAKASENQGHDQDQAAEVHSQRQDLRLSTPESNRILAAHVRHGLRATGANTRQTARLASCTGRRLPPCSSRRRSTPKHWSFYSSD